MRFLLGGGYFEAEFLDPVWGEGGENGADDAVFPCRVHGLEDEDDALFPFRIELLLGFVDGQKVADEFVYAFLPICVIPSVGTIELGDIKSPFSVIQVARYAH